MPNNLKLLFFKKNCRLGATEMTEYFQRRHFVGLYYSLIMQYEMCPFSSDYLEPLIETWSVCVCVCVWDWLWNRPFSMFHLPELLLWRGGWAEHIQNAFSKYKQMHLKTQSAVHDIVSLMVLWVEKRVVVCSGKDSDEKCEFAHQGKRKPKPKRWGNVLQGIEKQRDIGK